VVVVPGVAFSPRGDRLGRGGGHYDRALGAPPLVGSARAIGFAFDLQVVDEIPLEPHDVRVGVVVTEKRVLRAS
ncbi:MAG: 5-formyltetrahydrofolate cyclo-ligase, partial [Candidatus Binatia bacterium]